MSEPGRIRPIAVCVFRQGSRILVETGCDPVKDEHFHRPLGGAILFGERSADAVRREVTEELGAEVDEVRLLGVLENLFTFAGQPGHEAFAREGPDVPRDGSGRAWPEHHLYVCARESQELARHLAFRDWLRARPEVAAAYARLKRDLAERFRHDRDACCTAKTEFVERTLAQGSVG